MSVAAPLAGWVLCVMLDWSDPSSRVCLPEPDQATCQSDMRDWLTHWYAWQKRSGLDLPLLVVCGPSGIIG